MVSSGRKDAALNPGEESIIWDLRAALTTSKPLPPKSMDLIVRIITAWPYSERLAGLDVLRCVARYHTVAKFSSDAYGSLVDLAISASLPAGEVPSENAVMMGARALANIFSTADGRSLASRECDKILAFLERITGADGQDAIGKLNRNVLVATSTVALNLSVLVSKEKLLSPAQRRRLVATLGSIIPQQSDAEVLYRSLIALGTILSASPEVAAGSGAKMWAQHASERDTEERVKAVARECVKLASK